MPLVIHALTHWLFSLSVNTSIPMMKTWGSWLSSSQLVSDVFRLQLLDPPDEVWLSPGSRRKSRPTRSRSSSSRGPSTSSDRLTWCRSFCLQKKD